MVCPETCARREEEEDTVPYRFPPLRLLVHQESSYRSRPTLQDGRYKTAASHTSRFKARQTSDRPSEEEAPEARWPHRSRRALLRRPHQVLQIGCDFVCCHQIKRGQGVQQERLVCCVQSQESIGIIAIGVRDGKMGTKRRSRGNHGS